MNPETLKKIFVLIPQLDELFNSMDELDDFAMTFNFYYKVRRQQLEVMKTIKDNNYCKELIYDEKNIT